VVCDDSRRHRRLWPYPTLKPHIDTAYNKNHQIHLLALDGVIGDPHVWATNYFDTEAETYALELLSTSNAMLMGRRTYEFFAAAFPHRTGEYGETVNRIR